MKIQSDSEYRQLGLQKKRQLKNLQEAYADLNDYGSRDDIIEAYGYGIISETERDRLLDLWDGRELSKKTSETYEDRVIDMLGVAYRAVDKAYLDDLYEYEEKRKEKKT